MKRRHRIEISDRAWCPQTIKNAATDYCRYVLAVSKCYHAIAPVLAEALQRTGTLGFSMFVRVPLGRGSGWNHFCARWACVGETTEQLLARLQATLETNAPVVARALQPGLSDAQISEFETQGGFRLSDDLRALYRWHNGLLTNSTVGLLPGQRFVPLDEVVAERALMRQQSSAAFSVFAGHRKSWLHVLDDGAGDGYFYDPERTDAEGAFFFHFAEVGYYTWFPSLRNFLSGVVECYQTQAVKVARDGKSLDEDTDRTDKIWSRLGKSREG